MTIPLDVDDPFDADAELGPLPATPLAELITIRPPWSWSNLTEDEARLLESQLQDWIIDYNTHLTTAGAHVIPGCWRQHPALLQTVPVIYWAWWDAHRSPAATVRAAVEFHQRTLPVFQDGLDNLLVDKASAGKCRSGRHQDAPDADKVRLDAVTLAASVDDQFDVIDVLTRTTFGAAAP